MIPSILTTLALGIAALSVTGQALFASIVSSSAFVAGSQIITGHQYWLPDANTTTANSEYVGTQQTVKHTAGGYDFITNGTQSGIVLKADGLTRYKSYYTTCTATGGLSKYSTCYAPSPFSTTGSLFDVSLECGNVPKALAGDVSFKKSRLSASGAPLTNLDAITAGTGSLEMSQFATEVAWNSADALTYSTLVTPGSGVDCKLFYTVADHYGE